MGAEWVEGDGGGEESDGGSRCNYLFMWLEQKREACEKVTAESFC
jgi:hypothetical protein